MSTGITKIWEKILWHEEQSSSTSTLQEHTDLKEKQTETRLVFYRGKNFTNINFWYSDSPKRDFAVPSPPKI